MTLCAGAKCMAHTQFQAAAVSLCLDIKAQRKNCQKKFITNQPINATFVIKSFFPVLEVDEKQP